MLFKENRELSKLEDKIDEAYARTVELARQTRDLNSENAELYAENKELRYENEELLDILNKIDMMCKTYTNPYTLIRDIKNELSSTLEGNR